MDEGECTLTSLSGALSRSSSPASDASPMTEKGRASPLRRSSTPRAVNEPIGRSTSREGRERKNNKILPPPFRQSVQRCLSLSGPEYVPYSTPRAPRHASRGYREHEKRIRANPLRYNPVRRSDKGSVRVCVCACLRVCVRDTLRSDTTPNNKNRGAGKTLSTSSYRLRFSSSRWAREK